MEGVWTEVLQATINVMKKYIYIELETLVKSKRDITKVSSDKQRYTTLVTIKTQQKVISI